LSPLCDALYSLLVKVFTSVPEPALLPSQQAGSGASPPRGAATSADILARPMRRAPQSRDGWNAYSTAWSVIGTLIAGIVAWGGLGMLVDWLTGFRWLFLPIGMVVGVAGGIYLVWRRYGTEERDGG
jgi:F0F1-type ATP synthase assembly protein I